MLMGFFFLPPIHLSQQLSFILISFYLNLQNRAWDNKEAESLNNQAPCSAVAGDLETQRAVGKVARALLGVCGCRNCPQGSRDESPGAVSIRKAPCWQPQEELCCCICVAPVLHTQGWIFGIPSGCCCSSPLDVSVPCVLWVCCSFLTAPVSAFLLSWKSLDGLVAAFPSCDQHIANQGWMETLGSC